MTWEDSSGKKGREKQKEWSKKHGKGNVFDISQCAVYLLMPCSSFPKSHSLLSDLEWPGPPCKEGDGGSVSSTKGILHNAAFNSALLSVTTKFKIIWKHTINHVNELNIHFW